MKERVFDESVNLKDNSILRRRPELFYEWDFKKNDKLGLDVYRVTFGSEKIAWWFCLECKSSYDMVLKSRAGRGIGKRKGANCPYCAGVRVNHTNSLASLRPDLAAEWHPALNGDLTPHDVTCGSEEKVWWVGSECDHPWDSVVYSRTGESEGSCPYCSNQRVLKGFNDIWTVNPNLASLLANPEDGYKYSQSSHVRVDWKCIDCENNIKNKKIDNIYRKGLSCSRCSDGIKFPEKFMYNLLKESEIDFIFDEVQEWSKNKRYDFYFIFKDKTYIVETHGGQHYKESFNYSHSKTRTFIEEQENDRLKERLARENGIDKYIVIDCRYSTVEWIKNSILSSDIMKIIYDEIDFEKLGQLASSSFVKIACDLWNTGIHSAPQIAVELNISHRTVVAYLNRGKEIGWCNYEKVRKVVQLDKNLDVIHIWNSSIDIENQLGISFGNISAVCCGKRKTTGGYRWMYEEDYKKYLDGNVKVASLVNKNATSVVQLDANLNLIKVFSSQRLAAEAVGLASSTSISIACKENTRMAGGFKWMYKEDYDKLISNQAN